MTVQALFIDPEGPYPRLLGPENCWDQARDARKYAGPDPVVAHPPCHLWVNLAAVNYKRSLKELYRKMVLPAWYPKGSDEGCFASALDNLIAYGGVLEHPAFSHAFDTYSIPKPCHLTSQSHTKEQGPHGSGWRQVASNLWVCEVWQTAYGHLARKRTWLVYCSPTEIPPFELRWERQPGTHQVGWFDRNKPTLSKKEASRSPEAFAVELIKLAEWSKQ